MPTHYITCDICEALCGLEVTTSNGNITSIRGDKDDPLSRGHICPKALGLKDVHEDPDRLRHPVRRVGDSWEEIGWEEALDEVADRLHQVRAQHGRHAVATYTGNPTAHGYGALLGNLVLAKALRSHNRYSATSADQLPHMFAALEMFGHQLLLPVPDIDRTDLFVIFGANPAASNGSLMTAPDVVGRLKAIRNRGGRVVLFDPRRTETARHCDDYHFVRPGTDALVLLAMLHTIFGEGLADNGDWRSYAAGLDRLEAAAKRFPPERVAEACGVPGETIRTLARDVAKTPRSAVYGRVGVCTQRFGGLNGWLIYALNIVTGSLDREGGIMFTHPALDLVGLATKLGQQGHFDVRRSRVSGRPEFGGELPVSVLSEEIETPGDGQVKALVTLAGNPVLSTPNGARLDRALSTLDFMVSIDWYVTATTRHAHIILPPASSLERDHFGLAFHLLAVRNTVKYSPPLFPPKPGAMHDWDILVAISERVTARKGGPKNRSARRFVKVAKALGPRRILAWGLRMGPNGAGLNPFSKGLTLKRLEKQPHGVDLGPLRPCLPGRLATPDKTIRLAPERLVADVDRLEQTLDKGELGAGNGLVLIGRRDLRSNNTWLHNSERLVRGKDRCTLLIHPTDAEARGIQNGATVTLTSRAGSLTALAELDDGMGKGVVSLPHGWGHHRDGVRLSVAETRPGVSINDVTDETFLDELTGNAGFNGVPVEVSAV